MEASEAARDVPPPGFIIVCNNTNVSKMMYDYIADWEKELDGDDAFVNT
jgi:type III restriction enzyme